MSMDKNIITKIKEAAKAKPEKIKVESCRKHTRRIDTAISS